MSENKSTKRAQRFMNFATVVYLDSAPPNWQDILSDMHIQIFISPFHNKDINPGGELKKSHYHVMFMYDSVKSLAQAEENIKKINGVGCEIINSTRGYARYLCHLDNPEKYQYPIDEVKSLGGADYQVIIQLASDKYKIIGEMQDFCDKYNVTSFYLLAKYARRNNSNWYRSLCDNSAFYMKEYLKSKKWSNDNLENQIIDIETGEIIG